MTVTSVAVVTTKFLSGMCVCMADIDAGKGELLLILGILHDFGHSTCNRMDLWAWTAYVSYMMELMSMAEKERACWKH